MKQHSKVTRHNTSGKEHIVVLYGGLSRERDISLLTGTSVIEKLIELNYQVTSIDMGHDFVNILTELSPDIVFNALHGTYGEDGCVPGILDILDIKYTHSGVFASALAFDKLKTHRYLNGHHQIKMAEYMIVKQEDQLQEDPMPRPYVIKPLTEGSSIGVEIIFPEDDFSFANYKWEFGEEILIEKYIPGRELQVAVINNKAIGVLEIRPKARFYDYESKYTEGGAEHIYPAPVPDKIYKKALALSEEIHNLMYCKSISRVEFLYNQAEEELYLLELNTHPGMTKLSILPEIGAKEGIEFGQLLEMLLDDAKCR